MNCLLWITNNGVEIAFLRATRSFILGARELNIQPDSLIRRIILESLKIVFSGSNQEINIRGDLYSKGDLKKDEVTLSDVYLHVLNFYKLSWKDPFTQERFIALVTNQIDYELSLDIDVPEFFNA